MRIAYGIKVEDLDNRFVAMAQESMRVASLASAPGKWLVDSFPIRKCHQSVDRQIWLILREVRFIPKWFPGAKFRRLAEEWAEALYIQSLIPINYVKEQMVLSRPDFRARCGADSFL